jgi:hypothetical protein
MDNQETEQAVLVTQAAVDPDMGLGRIALFDESGDPVQNLESVSGADVVLTGLIAGSAAAPVATDTINQAVAKLQAEAMVGFTSVAAVTATAIGTAGKTTSTVEPPANSIVVIKFTNGNNAASVTVSFNGGAARAVLLGGTAPTGAKLTVAAGGAVPFWFDGTNLHQFGTVA